MQAICSRDIAVILHLSASICSGRIKKVLLCTRCRALQLIFVSKGFYRNGSSGYCSRSQRSLTVLSNDFLLRSVPEPQPDIFLTSIHP